MATLFFLVNTLLTIALYIIILRIWMQFVRVNPYNPFTQFIIKVTQPIIGSLRKIIPSIGRIDTASFILLYIIALCKTLFIMLSIYANAPKWDFYYLILALATIAHAIGHLIFWMLLIRAILSWISRGQSLAEDLLYQLTEPLVAPVRRIIPPLGMIDLSFMVIVFILIFLNVLGTELFNYFWLNL